MRVERKAGNMSQEEEGFFQKTIFDLSVKQFCSNSTSSPQTRRRAKEIVEKVGNFT